MSVGLEKNCYFRKVTGRDRIHVRLRHSPRQHIDFGTEIERVTIEYCQLKKHGIKKKKHL